MRNLFFRQYSALSLYVRIESLSIQRYLCDRILLKHQEYLISHSLDLLGPLGRSNFPWGLEQNGCTRKTKSVPPWSQYLTNMDHSLYASTPPQTGIVIPDWHWLWGEHALIPVSLAPSGSTGCLGQGASSLL